MRQRHRVPLPRVFLALVTVGFLVSRPAFPAGFQVMVHGARAAGMGLAYAGMSGDPTTIFYNPAGMAWVRPLRGICRRQLPDADGRPGRGRQPVSRRGRHRVRASRTGTSFPTATLVIPLTADLNFGLGGYAQYGLGLRWQDPNTTYNGMFISQNAVIQTLDTNPVFSYKLFPAALDRGRRRSTASPRSSSSATRRPSIRSPGRSSPVAHVKLNSDLLDNGGWGWNVGIMYKPVEAVSIGAAYRSSINIDYDGEATFTSRPTGNAAFDGLVAAALPTGNPPVDDVHRLPVEPEPRRGHRPGGRLHPCP